LKGLPWPGFDPHSALDGRKAIPRSSPSDTPRARSAPIGASLAREWPTGVQGDRPIDDTPPAQHAAGIRPGDTIERVDGEPSMGSISRGWFQRSASRAWSDGPITVLRAPHLLPMWRFADASHFETSRSKALIHRVRAQSLRQDPAISSTSTRRSSHPRSIGTAEAGAGGRLSLTGFHPPICARPRGRACLDHAGRHWPATSIDGGKRSVSTRCLKAAKITRPVRRPTRKAYRLGREPDGRPSIINRRLGIGLRDLSAGAAGMIRCAPRLMGTRELFGKGIGCRRIVPPPRAKGALRLHRPPITTPSVHALDPGAMHRARCLGRGRRRSSRISGRAGQPRSPICGGACSSRSRSVADPPRSPARLNAKLSVRQCPVEDKSPSIRFVLGTDQGLQLSVARDSLRERQSGDRAPRPALNSQGKKR